MACLLVACAVVFIVCDQRDEYKEQSKALLVQNVQLTKDVNTAKADAFKDGLITCSNEDIDYLNGIADEYPGTTIEKLFREMAMGWAYDDSTTSEMVEDYMDGGTN